MGYVTYKQIVMVVGEEDRIKEFDSRDFKFQPTYFGSKSKKEKHHEVKISRHKNVLRYEGKFIQERASVFTETLNEFYSDIREFRDLRIYIQFNDDGFENRISYIHDDNVIKYPNKSFKTDYRKYLRLLNVGKPNLSNALFRTMVIENSPVNVPYHERLSYEDDDPVRQYSYVMSFDTEEDLKFEFKSDYEQKVLAVSE